MNLLGAWRTVRACLPHVIERRGYVLVIASLAAAVHGPGMAAYSASKAGVEAFANSLRVEVAHLGVDVGVGYFGFIDTDLVRGADSHPAVGPLRKELPGVFGKTYPVSAVGDAIVAGMERRRRSIVVPSWVRPVLLFRGALGLSSTAAARTRRRRPTRSSSGMSPSAARRPASAPVGPGGEAAGRAFFEL